MSADVTKPALAPKPQGLDPFSSAPKFSSPILSRSRLVLPGKSSSRGPKPPIAPKPVLSPASERRCLEDEKNSLNRCVNGLAECPVEIYDVDHYRPACGDSEKLLDMSYGGYNPESRLTDEERSNLECDPSLCSEEPADSWTAALVDGDLTDDMSCSPSQAGEEDSGHPDSIPSRGIESGDSTEVEDSDNTDALSLRSSSTAEADSLVPHSGSMQFKNDLGDMDDFLPMDNNECNLESEERDSDVKEVILTDVGEDCPTAEYEHEGTEMDDLSLQDCEDPHESALASDHEEATQSEQDELLDGDNSIGDGGQEPIDNNEELSDSPIAFSNVVAGEQEDSSEHLDAFIDNSTGDGGQEPTDYHYEPSEVAGEREDSAETLDGSVDNSTGDGGQEPTDYHEDPSEVAGERENSAELLDGCIDNTPGNGGQDPTDYHEEPSEEVRERDDSPACEASEIVEDVHQIESNEEAFDESCQIIPYESEGSDDVHESSEQPLNAGSHANILEALLEPEQIDEAEPFPENERLNKDIAEPLEPADRAADGEGSHLCDGDPAGEARGEGLGEDGADTAEVSPEDQETGVKEVPVENTPTSEVTAEPEEDDSNPYVLEDSVQSRNRKLLHGEDMSYNKPEEPSSRPHGLMEEDNQDGDNHPHCIDRKNIVSRTRSYSGKIPGNVPETVPEETAAEMEPQPPISDPKAAKRESTPFDFLRALPRKPSRFTVYPRSYSVEGRENAASMYIESDVTFSPYLLSSSGSFSQRTYHSCSGMSTPTSVVDIPPPFELASITKKPITKSSPSLFIEHESLEKCFKKKKTSFKKFITLKFKKKTENKVHVDVNVCSSRSSSESSYHGPSRLIDMERRSVGNSPQLQNRGRIHCHPDSPTAMLFYKDTKRKGNSKTFSKNVARVESFEDRSRPPFLPLPLTKPRSISFPNADTSDYENIPAMNSDYENIQIPPRRPHRAGTFTEFFEDPSRALSSANENDGYVDMSSFNNFEVKQQTSEQEAESAYTEPYKVCPVPGAEDVTSDEEEQRSSEDDGGSSGGSGGLQKDGPARALNIVQELLTSEKEYVAMLRRLHTEFHAAILRALGSEEEDGEEELRLRHGLSQLQDIRLLHEEVVSELQLRMHSWEENQKIADIFLSRRERFQHHTAFIVAFDKTAAALEDCSTKSPGVASAVRDFERNFQRRESSVRHELVKVVQRIFQYHMILTDYLNNLCPDWAEYEDTQAALLIVSEVADRANESMRHGENLQKLVQIEHSVRGQRSLLLPGREFVKEGTLMKVTGKSRHPRHLFLMNDVLLYTYPQKDGKYRLKNTLSIPGMRVSRPIVESAQNVLKIECMECSLTLSASSCSERDDWFSCISRTVQEYYKAPTVSIYNNIEVRERLGMSLGERPPSVVHMSHAMMCMNCGNDFTLTLRRHHCHACGKIVCRSCSRNKYPLKYLKDRPSKVCNGCYAELRKRELATSSTNSSPQMPRSASSTLSSMFHSIHPSAFRRHKKVPSALMEAATSGESSSISGYLHRCKKGKKYWKKRWFVIKGKVLYTYTACEDKIATESLPLLGFRIVPDTWDQNPKLGTVFQLYHKQTLYYSFKAADTNAAIRWVDAIKAASVL